MARVTPPGGILTAIAIADERLSAANLSTGSSYSQQSPRPGSSVPSSSLAELVVQVSGEQSDTLTVTASKAGFPLVGPTGARVRYRLTGEAATSDRGWNSPNVWCGWYPVAFASGASLRPPAACVIPSTQRVVVSYASSIAVYNPWDNSVPTTATITWTDNPSTQALTGVCCLPESERLLCIGHGTGNGGEVQYSDDGGATWALYASNVLGGAGVWTGTTNDRARLLVVGDDLLFMRVSTVGGTIRLYHWVSTDRGGSFAYVGYNAAGAVGSPDVGFANVPDVVALPSGRVGWVTRNNGDNLPQVRVAPHAAAPFEDSTPIDIDASQTVTDVASWVDQNGVWYVLGRSSGNVYMWMSYDEGESWRKSDIGPFASLDASTYPSYLAPVAAAGMAFVAHHGESAAGTWDNSVMLAALGGWSQVVMDVSHTSAAPIDDADQERIAFGPIDAALTAYDNALVWVPYATPDAAAGAWTTAGAGTATQVTTGGGALELVTAANTKRYDVADTVDTANRKMLVWFELATVSGGAVATDDIAVRLEISDGTRGHSISIRFSATQIRVYDNNAAAALATVTVGTTTQIQVLATIRHPGSAAAADVYVAYRRPNETDWTEIYEGTAAFNVAILTGMLRWGHLAAANATSRWRMFNAAYGADGVWNAYGIQTPKHATQSNSIGGPITGRPAPLGDAAYNASGTLLGATFLRGLDGPARYGETHSIAPSYDYPAERLFWEISPDPTEQWKTEAAAGTTQTFEWIPSAAAIDTAIGSSASLALVVRNCNVQTINVYGDDGGGYDLFGAYNGALGFTGLTADVDGDQVTPNAATTTGGRFIQRQELVGGTFIDNAGAAWQIIANEEGHWAGSGRQVRLTLTAGATPTAGANCKIIAPNGVLVMHGTWPCRKWKIEIPWQTAPGNAMAAGNLALCGLALCGLPWDWGWSRTYRPNNSSSSSRSGTKRVREEGLPQRIVEVAWPQGSPLRTLRTATPPNYLSPHSSLAALAARGDVPWMLEGVVRQCRSAQIPVVAIQAVPPTATYTTMTDPSLYVFGVFEGDIRQTHVAGPAGDGEYVRIETISVAELVG